MGKSKEKETLLHNSFRDHPIVLVLHERRVAQKSGGWKNELDLHWRFWGLFVLTLQIECSIWWCSRLRRTILAKILASIGADAAAAAPRRTLAAPTLCKRVAWCTACRPPGMENCNHNITPIIFQEEKRWLENQLKKVQCSGLEFISLYLEKSKSSTWLEYGRRVSKHGNKSSNLSSTEQHRDEK